MSGFRFSDVVSAVQDKLHPQGAQPSHAQPTVQYSLDTGGSQDGAAQADQFPRIDEAKLYALFPSYGLDKARDKRMEESRRVVRATLDEMELNYRLDPLVLGERSDYNRGCAELVRLLASVRVQAPERAHGAAGPEDTTAVGAGKAAVATVRPARAYESHDLLKAIDAKDVETIMAIRDANFDLLLELAGGGSKSTTARNSTPLGYAMGLGKDYEGICIVLTGALSRFVNQLPDPEEVVEEGDPPRRRLRRTLDERTMNRLRKVRANLKLAIDSSLALEQTSLLASYCQVLNMSEGDMFIAKSVGAVQHALHARIVGGGSHLASGAVITSSDPFAVARTAVLQYVTEALRSKKDRIAALDDFVANSVGDLVLMSLWDAIRLQPAEARTFTPEEVDSVSEDLSHPLPTYFFARDDRVATHFVDRLDGLERALELLRAHGDAPKPARHPRMLKRAQSVAEALSTPTHRLSAAERLAIMQTVIMQ